MTQARKSQISLSDTPYYHCMGRCVRRAFLCGKDSLTGKDYSHRKEWIVGKLRELSEIFAIEVCAYAVMSNHYHVVLKVNNEYSEQMPDDEVIERWMQLFNGNVLIQRYLNNECKTQGELDKVQETIKCWRERLSDISWFMRCLNETIARRANAEDNCSGRFWEGRFKSQALLNDQAVLSCMAYVDLNPIRAGIADSLDESEFTSIEQRVRDGVRCEVGGEWEGQENKELGQENKEVNQEKGGVRLVDFVGGEQGEGIAYRFMDYLELVDWTGRVVRGDSPGGYSLASSQFTSKRGCLSEKEPKIISQLGIDADKWLGTVKEYSESYHAFVGSEKQLKAVCESTGKKWLSGMKQSRLLFN